LNGKQAVEAPDRGEAQGVNEEEGNTGPKVETRAVVLEESNLEQVPGSRNGIDGHVVRMRDSGSDVFKEHTDENISNPVGTIIGTSLGFVVPLITIYKFTPLGSWINTIILGRNKILKNMERNNQHLLLNSTENSEINSDDTMYRIKYNS
ncbi:Plasmodium vivax Vir protein, putative, partial [Plasmodium vivax]